MKTYLECYPCFMRQALEAARRRNLTDEKAREVMVSVGKAFEDVSLDMSPPEIGGALKSIIQKYTGSEDPYREEKREFTALAQALYPRLVERVTGSSQPLFAAAVIAIVGNIIDLAVLSTGEVRSRLDFLLSEELDAARRESREVFSFDEFHHAVRAAREILYIGDNAGETVFDKVLIEAILRENPEAKIAFATRGEPVLNDAILEDAQEAGLDEVASLISSGSDLPGTVLDRTTQEFQELFRGADLVISKGQGNYESLSDAGRDVFFLLIAKCPVLADDVGCRVGDIVLVHREPEL